MPVVIIDGQPVNVSLDQILADDGQNPFQAPIPSGYFAEDEVNQRIEAARSQEKDKLYGKIEGLEGKINEFTGNLTAQQEAERQRLEQEQAAAQAEARRLEEAELDAKTLLGRRESEWQQQLAQMEASFTAKVAEQEAKAAATEAMLLKEREFQQVGEYARSQIAAHTEGENADIAPELVTWITGNSKEEIDANIARAQATTAQILQGIQAQGGIPQQQQQQQTVPPNPYLVQPPQTPGTSVSSGPSGYDPTQQYQQYTPEQISQMPMSEFAKLRNRIGIGGSNSSHGMFG